MTREDAERIANDIAFWWETSDEVRISTHAAMITAALLAAYDRGLEDAAKVADKESDRRGDDFDYDLGRSNASFRIAASIRSLKGAKP